MINHARTLLLNMSTDLHETILGEEYVPASFRPLTVVPNGVRKVRNVLIGSQPDRHMGNFRMYQLMPLLHITEFAHYVTDYDPRITYWPIKPTTYTAAGVFGTTATRTDGSGTITFQSTPLPDESAGKIHATWVVTVTDSNTVTVQQLTPRAQTTEVAVTFTNGLSDHVALQGTFGCLVSENIGSRWTITSLARPQRNIADHVRILQATISDSDLQDIFGNVPAGNKEVWYNLWKTSPFYTYRLAGLLLATIDTMHARL